MGQTLDSLCFSLCSIFVPVFHLDRKISGFKNLRCMGGPVPQLGAVPNYWRWSLQVPSPPPFFFLVISAKSHPPWLLGASHFPVVWDFLVATPVPHCPLLHVSVQFPDPLYFSPVPSSACSCPLFSPLPPFRSPSGRARERTERAEGDGLI